MNGVSKKRIPLLFLAASMNSPAHAQLVENGDFEASIASAAVPSGWAVDGGNPAVPAAYTGDPTVPPSSGVWAVDLGPSGVDSQNGGRIFQTILVNIPGTYRFSFDYTNEFSNGASLADFFWSLAGLVEDGETLLDIGGGYQTFERTYSVMSTGNITITFGDVIGGGGLDAVIDNVSFAAVPLPAPISMLAIASIVLLGAGRRATYAN